MLKDVHQWKEFVLRRFKPSIFDFPQVTFVSTSLWYTKLLANASARRRTPTPHLLSFLLRVHHFMSHRCVYQSPLHVPQAHNNSCSQRQRSLCLWHHGRLRCVLRILPIKPFHIRPTRPKHSNTIKTTKLTKHQPCQPCQQCQPCQLCQHHQLCRHGHLRLFPRSLNLRKMRKWRNMRQPVTMAMATVTNVRIGRNFMIRSPEVLKCIQLSPPSIPPLLDLNLKWSHVWHHHGSCAPAIVAVLNRSKLEMTVTEKIASSGQMS